MKLTEFGKTVRKARIDSGKTLLTMAEDLKTSPAFLSSMETGRKKIPNEWIGKIYDYFVKLGITLNKLDEEAYVANKSIPLDSLNYQHQLLMAGFAKSELSQKQLLEFAELLEKFNKNSKGVRVEK